MSRGARRRSWETWRAAARRRVPRMIFDFVDGAAEDEVTRRRNRAAFDDIAFVGRVLTGVGDRDLRTTVLDEALSLPLILAPTGMNRASHRSGEVAAARAAADAGIVSVLAGTSSASAEEVAAAAPRPQWYQLYLYEDRARMLAKLETAKRLGYSTLVVTVDGVAAGNRERDVRNRLAIPIRVRPGMVLDALRHPRWLFGYLFGPPMVSVELAGRQGFWSRVFPGRNPSLAAVMGDMFNPAQTWADIDLLRARWDGPLVIKGIMCAEDARLAVEHGADGIVVSNHGGRQLDALPASIEVLPEIVAEVGDEIAVLLDSGVRRGSDVVKAIALGADACLVGRAWVHALQADGERGVRSLIEDFRVEIDRVMALNGNRTIADIDAAAVRRRIPDSWSRIGRL